MEQNLAIVSGTAMPAHLAQMGAIGNENITSDTLATPYLSLLQALSDQCVRGNPNYVQGAQPGQFLNSLTKELYDELFVSNLFMTRSFSVNKKRVFGQKDYRGKHPTLEAATAHLLREGVNPQDYDITDTHTHTLALINPATGAIITPIQFDMRNTGLKDSRAWNSNIVTMGPNVPRFAGVWKLNSKLNTNNKGSWYTPVASFAGWASEALLADLHTLYTSLHNQPAAGDAEPVELDDTDDIPF